MRRLVIAAALLAPLSAQAGGQQAPSVTENSWNGDFTGAWSTNNSGGQGGAGGAGGNATATGGDSSARSRSGATAGSGATSNNSFTYNDRDRLQAPATSGYVGAANCVNGGGLWGSGPGFSVGGAMNRVDADCHDLNVANMLCGVLNRCDIAFALLLEQPRVRAAAEVVANSPNRPPPVLVVAPPVVGPVVPNPDDWKVDPPPRPRLKARHRPVLAPAAAPAPGRVTQSAPPAPAPETALVDTAAATAPTGGWADSH